MLISAVAGVGAPAKTEGASPRYPKRNPHGFHAAPPGAGLLKGAGLQGKNPDAAAILGLAREIASDPWRQGLARLELLLALSGRPDAEVEARRLVQEVAR